MGDILGLQIWLLMIRFGDRLRRWSRTFVFRSPRRSPRNFLGPTVLLRLPLIVQWLMLLVLLLRLLLLLLLGLSVPP